MSKPLRGSCLHRSHSIAGGCKKRIVAAGREIYLRMPALDPVAEARLVSSTFQGHIKIEANGYPDGVLP